MEKPRSLVHHLDDAEALISAVLSETPPSIMESVSDAVTHGRMTQDEANECLESYYKAFHKFDHE